MCSHSAKSDRHLSGQAIELKHLRFAALAYECGSFRKAAELLPSSAANPPTVDLTQPGLSPQSRTAVVTVFWKLPGEAELHRLLMTAQIGKNPP